MAGEYGNVCYIGQDGKGTMAWLWLGHNNIYGQYGNGECGNVS